MLAAWLPADNPCGQSDGISYISEGGIASTPLEGPELTVHRDSQFRAEWENQSILTCCLGFSAQAGTVPRWAP